MTERQAVYTIEKLCVDCLEPVHRPNATRCWPCACKHQDEKRAEQREYQKNWSANKDRGYIRPQQLLKLVHDPDGLYFEGNLFNPRDVHPDLIRQFGSFAVGTVFEVGGVRSVIGADYKLRPV